MALLTLDIEKAVVGGRMLARRQGQIVLVSGAIPGERVTARLERAGKGVLFAEVVDVLTPSADRRAVTGDWRCGGAAYAHIEYRRQLQLKAELVQDAMGRIGRLRQPEAPEVLGSPEHGYRMRARLHVRDGRIGFVAEGTHRVCDAASTGQLLPATAAWIAAAQATLVERQLAGVVAIDLAENVRGDERACHLELASGTEASAYADLAAGLVGLSAERADRPGVVTLAGTPAVTDVIHASGGAQSVRLQRGARAFFQGNRHLLERLVQQVATLVPAGPVIDLYAGVGLFGLTLAAAGRAPVTLVEGDPVATVDLRANAGQAGASAVVECRSVETFLAATGQYDMTGATIIVDPPRTGLSKEAISRLLRLAPSRLVYVSCDVATLARDTRILMEAGYRLDHLSGMDLFPNTAHVESIAAFTLERGEAPESGVA